MGEAQEILALRFPGRARHLKEMRDSLRAALREQDLEDAVIDAVILGVNEACMNIIQHGYGDVRVGDIILEVLREADELVMRLSDFADPVDVSTIKSRDLEELRPGGLGVYLIAETMDQVRFLDAPPGVGNLLELRKRLG